MPFLGGTEGGTGSSPGRGRFEWAAGRVRVLKYGVQGVAGGEAIFAGSPDSFEDGSGACWRPKTYAF